jgi:uncharacterized membrane protein
MTSQLWKHIAVSSALLGLMLTASLAGAQIRAVKGLPGKRAGSSASQAPVQPSITAGTPSYTFTLLSYPGQLYSAPNGINPGATTSKVELVGGYANTEFCYCEEGGFLARVSGTKTITETYQAVTDPHGAATGINDLGQIVGIYEDTSGVYQGYEKSGGKFTELTVPFSGASGTFPYSINNSGEVVGGYNSAAGGYSFTLIAGTYTSFNYPGAVFSEAFDVNTDGDIVGVYSDTSGVFHGFLLSGGTYSSVDFPGATYTEADGINDSGEIVGWYCTTSECVNTSEGGQGFLLSGGTFTTIAIPNEFASGAVGISNNGVIVGQYLDAAGVAGGFMATQN